MQQEKDSSNCQYSNHLCNDCFFNEIHNTPEKRYHCNLFTKHVPQEMTSCINYAKAQEVAYVIVNHKSFSKKIKEELILNIIIKKIESAQYNMINEAVLATREVNNFEVTFDKFCEKKLNELNVEDFLISRKPVNPPAEPGWDRVRIYNETRKHQDGTAYVRKIKLMMTVDGLSDVDVVVQD